ncbi:MAG: FtsX-like permease family protein, partial [Candidatus Neomarinimicrobiota bacterium]
RAKEVGLRKVVGSSRSQLLLQFITESLLISGIALLLVLPLAQLATPFLNTLADTAIAFNKDSLGTIITFLIVALIVVGGLAGFYPALVLSRYKPITVLKGSFSSSGTGNLLRKTLVILQFTLSIALICLTLIVKKQMDYIQNKDLGYDREQVLIVDMFDPSMGAKLDLFRSELLQHSAFTMAAISSNLPGRTFGRTGVRPEGAAAEDIWIWSTITVTPESLPTLGMEIKEGRNFSREMSSDTSGVVLVNDIAIRKLGWDDPIGRRLYFGTQDSIGQQIIGVVEDFHFVDFSQPIEPVVIFPIRNRGKNVLAARIAPGMIPPAIEHAEKIWTQIYPDYPFSYGFMDDEFNALYRQVTNTSSIMDIFAGLAIFIAALGLFGLVSHATTQRTKEIGIRKVVGASTATIVRILILDFLRLVSLSILIAVPIAWYGGTKWLESFVYRTSPGYGIFLIAGATALLIAIVTVSFQAIKAALANPVKSLRYE